MFVMYLQLHFLILYRYSINQCIKIIYIWPFSANTISSVATWKNMTEKFQSNSSTSTTEPISHYSGLTLCFLVTRQRFVSSTIQQKNCVFLKKHLVVPTMQCCLIQSCPSFFHKKEFRGDIYLEQIQQMSIKTYQFSKILSMLKSHLEFFLSCRSTLNENVVAEYHAKIFSIIFIVQLLEIPERVKMILVSILFLTLLKIDWPQLQRFAQASHYFAFHPFLFSVRSAENQKKKYLIFF